MIPLDDENYVESKEDKLSFGADLAENEGILKDGELPHISNKYIKTLIKDNIYIHYSTKLVSIFCVFFINLVITLI